MLSARDKFFAGGEVPGVSYSTLGLGIEVVGNGTANGAVYNPTTYTLNLNGINGKEQQQQLQNGYKITSTEQTPPNNLPNDLVNDNEPFSNLPSRDPLDMEFKNLSLTVQMGWRGEAKEILHNVNGKFIGSQLIAIMGPSGAGKSTLLDALSGFKTTGVNGSILINGRRRDLTSFRRLSCYITQDDRLQPLLTVHENMHIAADLKLGTSVTFEDKESRVFIIKT